MKTIEDHIQKDKEILADPKLLNLCDITLKMSCMI